MDFRKSGQFRHPKLSVILIGLAVTSTIAAGVVGFGFDLYMPTVLCMAVTFVLMVYVGYFEARW